MPDPAELLLVARTLSDANVSPPSDAALRRAVSTVYYALFHKVLRAAARRFMGPGMEASAGYALLYRSFDHGHMRAICQALNVTTLRDTLKHQLGRSAVSPHMREFADSFIALQELRHLADYDPLVEFQPSDVASLVDAASVAMAAFDRVLPSEQADVLALMMVRARG